MSAGAKEKPERRRQCKTCPWRVGADPNAIPGYRPELHKRLHRTIVSGEASISSRGPMMACHYSPAGAEFHCAGWVHHAIGVGNNIGMRMQVSAGLCPIPVVVGRQHQRFEDTLPREEMIDAKARARR